MNVNKQASMLISTLQCIAAGIVSGALITVLLCLIVLLISGNAGATESASVMISVNSHHSYEAVTERRCSKPARITIKKDSCAVNDCPPPPRLVAGRTRCLYPHQGKSCTTPPEDGLGWNTQRNKELKLWPWAAPGPSADLLCLALK
jgi:hypothetical protein